MGIHPTLKAGLAVAQVTDEISAALRHMFPLNSIRKASTDELRIEDDEGREWALTIEKCTF